MRIKGTIWWNCIFLIVENTTKRPNKQSIWLKSIVCAAKLDIDVSSVPWSSIVVIIAAIKNPSLSRNTALGDMIFTAENLGTGVYL